MKQDNYTPGKPNKTYLIDPQEPRVKALELKVGDAYYLHVSDQDRLIRTIVEYVGERDIFVVEQGGRT